MLVVQIFGKTAGPVRVDRRQALANSGRNVPWKSDVHAFQNDSLGIRKRGIEFEEFENLAQQSAGRVHNLLKESEIDLFARKDRQPPLQLAQIIPAQTIPIVGEAFDPLLISDFVESSAEASESRLLLSKIVPRMRPGTTRRLAH